MKKKIILIIIIFILSFLDIYLFSNYIYARLKNKKTLENYEVLQYSEISNNEFKIDKIILFSSASGINQNTNFQKNNWVLDIFQYTDMAIYFSPQKTLTPSNTIQKLSISNVKFHTSNQKYTPSLYYLDANCFGTDNILYDYQIINTLNFSIVNSDNKDNSIVYNAPIFFADLSNPITLKFTNTLIKKHSIDNTEKIIFDGTLLNKTPLTLENLKANISFDINITNYNNENYIGNLNIEIPLIDENQTIYNGSILKTEYKNLSLLKETK